MCEYKSGPAATGNVSLEHHPELPAYVQVRLGLEFLLSYMLRLTFTVETLAITEVRFPHRKPLCLAVVAANGLGDNATSAKRQIKRARGLVETILTWSRERHHHVTVSTRWSDLGQQIERTEAIVWQTVLPQLCILCTAAYGDAAKRWFLD